MKMKMLKKIVYFIGFTLFFPLFPVTIENPTMLTLPVQFPSFIKTAPHICMYYRGYRIKPDETPHGNKILFSILESRMRTHFWLLITDTTARPEMITDNTVHYLKIDPLQCYKFYFLSLIVTVSADGRKTAYTWEVQEYPIPANGRLPDDILIVSYDAALVDRLEGGNALELPTIVIKQDVLDIVGSEALLHEKSAELLLSSLDYNALHATIQHEIRYDHNSKTICSLTT